jgi:hypothetical protein
MIARALFVLGIAGCASHDWLKTPHILVDGYDETNMECRDMPCPHDENTDLVVYEGATYLVHRTANSQILGPNSSLRVYRSTDHGATWSTPAIIPAPMDRDLRDPHFYTVNGQLALHAITRLPVNSTRDSNVDSISVNTISSDGGTTWSALTAIGPEQQSFWRTRADDDGTWYSAAYHDGDTQVQLFSSADGVTWTAGAVIYDVSADTPLETELLFHDGTMTALVRMDGTDDEILGNQGRLRTKICTATRPYTTFDCSLELDGQRWDGPVAFAWRGRTFVVARKHLPGVANKKRTALYEFIPPASYVEHGEFPSAGDTSYAGVAPIDADRFLVSYYSSNVQDDQPWARAMFEASDIWQATIDLSKL